jgi:hypothetical protein
MLAAEKAACPIAHGSLLVRTYEYAEAENGHHARDSSRLIV